MYSTDFFDNFRNPINSTGDAGLKRKLQAIGSRRDELTADLAQVDPIVKEKIEQMYADFYRIVATP